MKKLKVLNLYAGIGGNRKLWKDVEVTAVEYNEDIAKIYQNFFPDDKVIVADAHKYLLDHYDDGWDFIWASPPCPTHSRMNHLHNVMEDIKIKYPNMELYQEIILLQSFFKGLYCVENVISYYEPLIKPQELDNHYFWTNFYITKYKGHKHRDIRSRTGIESKSKARGFNMDNIKATKKLKDKVLSNAVFPEVGSHILECARAKIENRKIKAKQQDLFI